jgi:hypothetical protein
MKPVVWSLRVLFGLSVAATLFGGLLGPHWHRIGLIGAIALLVALVTLRRIDLARRRKSPAFF